MPKGNAHCRYHMCNRYASSFKAYVGLRPSAIESHKRPSMELTLTRLFGLRFYNVHPSLW